MCARAMARALSASVSRTTRLLGRQQRRWAPMISRARAVCSGGTKYGCDPAVRSAASASIFGASAPITRSGGRLGGTARNGAASIASR